jgi:hypothetical protein
MCFAGCVKCSRPGNSGVCGGVHFQNYLRNFRVTGWPSNILTLALV